MNWWPIEQCPRLPGVPYLLKTADGPVIAEWDGAHWFEWLGGGFYGTSPASPPTDYIEIPA